MGTLVFQATLGGQVNLTGPNTASTFTINVPAVSGTMAALASVTNNGVAYVNGSGQPTSGSALTFDGNALEVSTSGSTRLNLVSSSTSAGAGAGIFMSNAAVIGRSGRWLGDTSNNLLIASRTTSTVVGDIVFGLGDSYTEQMRLTSTGLGIGTSSPAAKLDVSQATAGSNAAKILHVNGNGIFINPSYNYYDAYNHIFRSLSGSTTYATIDNSGNLGLGVTPSAWASGWKVIESAGSNGFVIASANVNPVYLGANWYSDGTNRYKTNGSATLHEANSNGFRWYVAPSGTAGNAISFTQAMTLDASGNLLVGTTTAQNSSSGRGNITLGGSSSAIFNLSVASANSGSIYHTGTEMWFHNRANGPALFFTNDTERARIDSSGNLLVGTTSNPVGDRGLFASPQATNNTLALVSTDNASGGTFIAFRNSAYTAIGTVARVTTTNAVVYNTTSDYRLKTVTGAVTGQGARIDALKPIDYLWTEGGQQARGFLAHEFQEVYPNSVTGDKDAVDANGNPVYQAMQASTAEVIADLVAEIKSLRVRVAQLESN